MATAIFRNAHGIPRASIIGSMVVLDKFGSVTHAPEWFMNEICRFDRPTTEDDILAPCGNGADSSINSRIAMEKAVGAAAAFFFVDDFGVAHNTARTRISATLIAIGDV